MVQKLKIKAYRLLTRCELLLKGAQRSGKRDLKELRFPHKKCGDPPKAEHSSPHLLAIGFATVSKLRKENQFYHRTININES